MSACIHATVVEMPVDRCLAGAPRELLPWADPYIAQLILSLACEEERWESEGK